MSPQSNNNNFFGIKVSKPGINVNQASPSQLIYQNDYSAETFYGLSNPALKLGNIGSAGSPTYGMNIYDSNGNITMTLGELGSSAYGMSVPSTNGTINFGLLSNGNLGMQAQDTSGYVLFEMDGQTWYWYDKTTGKNVMQVGLLPDGTYGWAVAASGYNVADGF